ncbi:MAG: hypothetical protein KAU90_09865, partial [Sulfurovaceae bacterium]|nr:hypothetical protein [Sulfurovaceae bacterium]
MYRNRVKIVVLLLIMLLIGGCAGKRDFTKGVSEEDKKLLSSKDDKVLFIYDDIRITNNGFYPNNLTKDNRTYKYSKYHKRVASYSKLRKINLKRFMDDVNKYKLKNIRTKLLPIFKRFPNLKLKDKEELNIILSKEDSEKKYAIILKSHPEYIQNISNPNEKLQYVIVSNNLSNIKYIKNPTEAIKSYIKRKTACNKEGGGCHIYKWSGGIKGWCKNMNLIDCHRCECPDRS